MEQTATVSNKSKYCTFIALEFNKFATKDYKDVPVII